jgi:DNA polymerase-1
MTRLLVDGNGVVCRAWWASPARVFERFTAAIEGARPSSGAEVTLCWDSPAGSWRRELYARYKAARPPKPKDLTRALAECCASYPDGVAAPGFEADDLIATLARQCTGELVLILTDDKDMAQLVGPQCLTVNSAGNIYGVEAVQAKFGVPPFRIRHLLSWMGDAADGLPGVRGYGPKKAIPPALRGEIGDRMTYDLTELANVPPALMLKC